MAYGTELILGFKHPKLLHAAETLGLTIDLEEEDLAPNSLLEDINKRLEEAWLNCLRNDLNLESDAVLGISLITRYSPCFLDLDKPHGGSGEPIVLNQQTLSKIKLARDAITTVLPWSEAEIIIKMFHY